MAIPFVKLVGAITTSMSRGRRRFPSAAVVAIISTVFSLALFTLYYPLVLHPGPELHRFAMRKDIVPTALLSLLWASASSSAEQLLFVTSYAGDITTLDLTLPAGNVSLGTLKTVATNGGCAPNPAWLTLDSPNSLLYCLGEGFNAPNGSLSSFKTDKDGVLIQEGKIPVVTGAVNSVIYGKGGKGLAVAHYGGSSLSTFSIADPVSLSLAQQMKFQLPQPGLNQAQDAPHPHQAILDPTGKYLLVPDLGADLVRVFRVPEDGLQLEPVAPLTVAPGSGPRHAALLATPKGKTFMYVVSELANTITGYQVTYNANATLGFAELFAISTHGPNATVPVGTAAAEIVLSPDNRFLLASSRNESSFRIPNFDPKNSTEIVSDAIVSYALDHDTGGIKLAQIFPSGGRMPRQFSLNKAGNLVAVGSQSDARVAIIERDVQTGHLKRFVAAATVAAEVTCAIFKE